MVNPVSEIELVEIIKKLNKTINVRNKRIKNLLEAVDILEQELWDVTDGRGR